MLVSPKQFKTYSLEMTPRGDAICRILAASINGADPSAAIKKKLIRQGSHLSSGDESFNLDIVHRVFVIGFGKASIPMAAAVNAILDDVITSGLVITNNQDNQKNWFLDKARIKVVQARHPLPDQSNMDAGDQLFRFLTGLVHDDLVIVLISGGGSSLLTKPAKGISLSDLQQTTHLLLKCGASIEEINTIRKHLDIFKGGGLARLLYPASVLTLVLSDVVGDMLDVIASGPTVADSSTFYDAWAVISKYHLENQIPASVSNHISAGMEGKIPETLKPGNPYFDRVTNIIIGNNVLATECAENEARKEGFYTIRFKDALKGEASITGKNLVNQVKARLRDISSPQKPACFIAGGETIVTINGDGQGGRNQELVLGAVECLSGPEQYVMVSLGTDGVDGPTDAAGAVVTNQTYSRGLELGMHPNQYLAANNSHNYFMALGDLIKIGPTFTNVNDLAFIFAL